MHGVIIPGSANTVAVSMKNSLVIRCSFPLVGQTFTEKESLVTVGRFPWHRGIQKCYVIAKVMRKEDNYSVCTAVLRCSVISEKESCYLCHLLPTVKDM